MENESSKVGRKSKNHQKSAKFWQLFHWKSPKCVQKIMKKYENYENFVFLCLTKTILQILGLRLGKVVTNMELRKNAIFSVPKVPFDPVLCHRLSNCQHFRDIRAKFWIYLHITEISWDLCKNPLSVVWNGFLDIIFLLEKKADPWIASICAHFAKRRASDRTATYPK